jgi:pimeloyl-ACP methyl ester carboxylesterase
MPKVKIDGFKLYYKTSGEGFPLTMIMGLGANSQWWDKELIDRLNNHFKVILFDNRGTGRSEDPGDNFNFKILAEDVVKMLEKLNITETNLLGISMGGMIAQEIALNFPEKLRKLILCSTYCGGSKSVQPSPEVVKILSKPRSGRPIEEIVDETVPLLYTSDFISNNPGKINEAKENMKEYPISEETYQKQGKAIFSHNTCRKLKEMKVPTLILHGQKDVLIPPKNGEILHNYIPNSELTMFENTGHALFYKEPDKITQRIVDFLKN